MKKLKYLFYVIAIILSFFAFYWFKEVNALSIPDWNTNIDYTITRGEFYNWTSSTAYSQVDSEYLYLGTDASHAVFTNKNNVVTATNGISFTYFLNQYLDPDYLYNVTTYVCADFNINNGATGMTYPFARSSGGYPGVLTENMQYSYTTSSALSATAFTGESFTGCRQYTSIIQPSVRSSWFALRFTSSSSLTGHYYVLGFNLESLGVASNVIRDEIQTIIDNSGLASASSVEEVQDSVEQVQAEMQEVNSSIDNQTQQQQQNHQETMDTITSSDVDSPSNAFTEFESYLPENGVITELITLPISLFQRVLSSINGSCSEYNLGNLLGTDLKLPCINISNYIGTILWNVIDVLFSGLFVLVISKKMIKVFNNFTNMEEGDVLD